MIATDYLRFFVALIAVLGLIALCAWVARRFRLGGLVGSAVKSGRLEVIETLPIDGRQRLVLLRRDDREHLLMLGQDRSVVIESCIETSKTERAPRADAATPVTVPS